LIGIAFSAVGAVQDESLYPEDALFISDAISEYLGIESMVSLTGEDSTVVLFVALGGEWTGEPDQWSELIVISSAALHIDLQRSFCILDIAVSFGNSWCRIPVDELLLLSGEDLDESEFLERFQEVTEILVL